MLIKKIKPLIALCCILPLCACTDTSQWGITEESSSAEIVVVSEPSSASSLETGSSEVSSAPIYASWEVDPDSLYKDEELDLSSFEHVNRTARIQNDVIDINGADCSVTVDNIELFNDARDSGKHGIAIIYTIKNNSGQIVAYDGSTDSIARFAMFAPDGTALKSHYNIKSDPPEDNDYPERISFKNASLYLSSMNSIELKAGESYQMYRMYDYAGFGVYSLFLSTDNTSADISDPAAVFRFKLG
ncbi:MAG: hypothetical protein LBC56_02905 [Oscillospiraceae bacterium]|jgi:hypothetical protein|nr:hypothetical protein [Oscillospiraceae bacterium]